MKEIDLRREDIRKEYRQNHIKGFLKNHESAIEIFKKSVKEKYGDDIACETSEEGSWFYGGLG